MIRRAPPIPRREFEERRSRAAEAVRRSGLDALLVCGRGGGTLDRYGDVMYLTNFYSSFPFIPDYGDHWSARAHPFVLLAADGRARLLADIPVLDEVAMPREDVVRSDRVLETLIEEMDNARYKAAAGVRVASRLIREVREICDGTHIMAIGWESRIPDILESADLV